MKRKIIVGDTLRCITDREKPFDLLSVGDTIDVFDINDSQAYIKWKQGFDSCSLGDLYLNFEVVV